MQRFKEQRWFLFLDRAKALNDFIRRRVGNSAEADEIFQELSLVVLRHASGPDEVEKFSAWCHAIARHVLAHHFRAKRRQAKLLDRVELEGFACESCHYLDPERAASARELLKLVGKRLDPQGGELLSQRYLLGESTGEIAQRLAQSEASVRMRLMRLRLVAKREHQKHQ
jgi:RNA polymerase sigma factor (sigma-70 family)